MVQEYFLFVKKKQKYGTKNIFFPKNLRGYKRLFFFICFRQVSIEQIQTSIIHIAPCSQEIIDNENPICYVFLEDAKKHSHLHQPQQLVAPVLLLYSQAGSKS
jgi:hypothetical protein